MLEGGLMAQPKYSKSYSSEERIDRSKRQMQARKEAKQKAAKKAQQDEAYNKYRTKVNSRYESKQKANATNAKKKQDAYNQFKTKTNSRYESKRKADATNEKKRKDDAYNKFRTKANSRYESKRKADAARKQKAADDFYSKVNKNYEHQQQVNKANKYGKAKARMEAAKRKQMLKRDATAAVRNASRKLQEDIRRSPTPSRRPDENYQSVRTGKERQNAKYIDKVKTKSGKIRYIYDPKQKGGTNKRSNASKQGSGGPLSNMKKFASLAAKSLSRMSSRAVSAGSNFIKSLFR